MEIGIGHIVCNANCELCSHNWIAVVEVDYIDYGDKKEYKKPNHLQCPNCMNNTDKYEVVIHNKEVQIPFFSSYKIGDKVLVDLHKSGSFEGIIIGVKFQLGKVFYDVDIFPFENEKSFSFRFRDIDSYFIKDLNTNEAV